MGGGVCVSLLGGPPCLLLGLTPPFSLTPVIGEPTESHPFPHQPARGDQRADALHALQPVSFSGWG